MATNIKLNKISKKYETSKEYTLRNISVEIEPGEFLAIIGPSGCGKSTTLRMIAGFEEITDGDLMFNDKLMTTARPDQRNIAMVFQDYALFAHMTVEQNIGYSLKVAKKDKQYIKQVVNDVAKKVSLEQHLLKKPKELSGGQRQRVALARALAKESDIILMDEPLSNLDVELRARARMDIVKVNKEEKRTIIYVTHDQVEAMTMADRIMILNNGEIKQIGTTAEIYNKPQNVFVAKFIGNPGMNIIESSRVNIDVNECKYIGIRPDKIKIVDTGKYTGIITNVEDYGNELLIKVKCSFGSLQIKEKDVLNLKIGDNCKFEINPKHLYYFDENENNMYLN